MDIVREHNKEWDCWIILESKVYDVTLYLAYHPGGKKSILEFAGKDATDAFATTHPWVNFHGLLHRVQVGFISNE